MPADRIKVVDNKYQQILIYKYLYKCVLVLFCASDLYVYAVPLSVTQSYPESAGSIKLKRCLATRPLI